MAKKKITPAQLEMLNSKHGLYHLLKQKDLDVEQAIEDVTYTLAMREEQEKLIHLQNWVIEHDQKVVILFEGRDVAGKGGAIKKITEHINPRHFRVAALNIPTEDEQKQWFFQRYIKQLPRPGEIVFFDRSWYNRAVVEPVNGFCTKKEYKRFMSQVNDFEKMVVHSDTYLLKLFFSIKKKEQARRFAAVEADHLRQWQLTPVDRQAQALWNVYTRYEKKMFAHTDTKLAPWKVINANKRDQARLEAITYIIERIPYTKKPK
ncbi:MAG TPA: polyphosphate kinase 2 [Saprospiraceae bacterium]|nr:polyphosphate kinase 2 [Saprospiraceae bacterium]